MGLSFQINNQSGLYFLTFQIVGWVDIFTRQNYRDIIIESFDYCRKNKGLEIFSYVIMSNHVHCILRSKSEALSDTIRDLKKHSSKKILDYAINDISESRRHWLKVVFEYHAKYNKRVGSIQLWTHENHAIELNTNEIIDSKMNYIHLNPIRAGIVLNAEDYLYSSARNYSGLSNLLEIDNI